MNPVENFILKHKGAQQELLAFLHDHLKRAGLKPKLAYGIPMFYGKKWICYLKPNKDQSLDLSFTRAHQFEDPTGLLERRGRRQISSIVLRDLETIPLEAIDQILEAALALDAKS
ncbi:DUF1801 domain-containing protein [Croceimicrobium sp.]|uniref:DUF1801 domain-containing protein n=1 Tax=Croceimicrobium sp. TaxID=2828340 RepID=UPI003BAB81AD